MFRSTLNALSAVGLLLLSCAAFALPPVASPPSDSGSWTEDFDFSSISPSDLSLIFTDPDGDPMTYSLLSESAPAVATVSVDTITGLATFTSIPDANGTQTFVFQAEDSNTETGTFTFTMTLTPVNDTPFESVAPPAVVTPEDTPTSTSLAGVFDDVDIATNGDSLTLTVEGAPTGAVINTATMSGTNLDITYLLNQSGPATVTVRATDTALAWVETTVNVTVNAVNDAPVAVGDADATNEDTVLNVAAPGVLGNDSDPVEGDPLTAVLDTTTTNGVLVLNANGSYTYTPNADYNGADSFTYHANDGTDDSNIVTVNLTVNAINDAPVAVADADATNEDTVLNVAAPGVLGNDSDIDGDALTAVLDTTTTNGALVLNANGSYSYTPNLDFNGADSFTYRANDGITNSNVVTVSLTVNSIDDVPVAVADADATNEDTVLNVAAPGVLGNDVDVDGDGLTAVLGTTTTNGLLVLNANGSYTYTPNADFNGADSFTYRANDGITNSNIVTVNLTVNAVNDAPVAVADADLTAEDTVLNVAAPGVLGNDSDPVEGDPLTAVLDTTTTNGVLVLNANGSFSYTPNADFNGADSFSYHANDGTDDSNIVVVNLTVTPVNDAPVAVADADATNEDTVLNVAAPGVLGNDSDVDGDALSAVLDTTTTNGVLVLNGDGSFSYTPNAEFNGADSFTYRANDGTLNSGTVTVNLTVNAVNDAPVVIGAVADVTVDEDSAGSSVLFTGVFDDVDILTNGDVLTLTVSATTGSVIDTASMTGNTLNITYLADQNGPATVTVRATDTGLAFAEFTMNVTVNPVNDTPFEAVAPPAVVATEDTPTSTSLIGVFDDVDIATNGDSLTLSVTGTTGAVIDTASMSGTDLNITYLLNQNGAATVTVRATDTALAWVETTVNVTVNPANDAPVVIGAVADVTVDEDSAGSSVLFSGVFDDVDILTNGDVLTLTVSATTGSVIDTASMTGNTLNITYLADQNGPATVTVRATDTGLAFAEFTMNVTVNPVNDDPVVVPPVPAVFTNEDSAGTSTSLVGVFDDVDIVTNADFLALTVTGTTGSAIDTASLSGQTLNLTYLPNGTGAATVTVRATDTALAWVEATINVTVNSVNDVPVVVGAAAAVTVDEDSAGSSVDFSAVFDDVDIVTSGDVLTLTVSASAGTAIDTAIMTGNTLNITYLPDQNGPGSVSVRATDTLGAWVEHTVNVTVNPVNDAPFVANPIPDVNTFEDNPLPLLFDLSVAFADVDIVTNGDFLTFTLVSNSNPSMFSSVTLSGGTLTLVLAADQNGIATFIVRATDSAGASVTDTFNVDVAGVNDFPVPADDTVVIPMNEDDPFITISVLDNDYLAEQPTLPSSAGVGGFSESPPSIVIDPFGDPIAVPNGTVKINGSVIEYEPKPDFYGTDYFTYVITDVDGDVSPPATVTITVLSVNDPPVGIQERTYSMLENGVLTVAAGDGVFLGAYDVDGKLLDGSGNEIGSPLSAVLSTLPAVGSLTFDGSTGEFTYTPPINFTGNVSFTYRLFDGIELSATPEYVVRIVVNPAPPPVAPPPAGEVAVIYDIANVPLEQTSSVPPNVLVVMDDSGSMDWNLIVDGADENGGALLENSGIAISGQRASSYVYMWDLSNNAYPPTSQYGRVLPTEQALAVNPDTDNNQFGVWRGRTHLGNAMYYNPRVLYTPWVGQDENNIDFADADPSSIRLDPVDASNTFDMLADHDYTSNAVPQWDGNGGTTNVAVDNLYIPRYYATAATPPLQWNDARTLIEIKVGSGPLAGDMFPGGPNREDCAADDNNPVDCTFAQEMQNFANWFQYYRSREYVTKNGMGKVIAEVQDIRVGYETISATTSTPVRDMNDLYTEGDKKALLDNIYSVDSFGGTPLRQALGRAGQIFECSTGSDCPALPAPDGTCQLNFALLFSDGYWNGGTGVATNDDEDGAGPFDGGRYEDTFPQTLADVAMHYYEKDLFGLIDNEVPLSRRDVLGAPIGTFAGSDDTMHQHMKTFAIAFGVNGTISPNSVPNNVVTPFSWPDPFSGQLEKIDDMLHAAVNGRGDFLNASNPQQLQLAFESTFLEFTQAASSSSAAAFNSTSLRDGTLLFRGFYDLRDNIGELTATVVNTDGTIAASPTWRASEQLNPANKLPGDRILLTSHSTTGNGVPFRHPLLAPQQQITVTLDEVNYLRGERTNEWPGGFLRQRLPFNGLLGDIVNSNPVFVGAPRAINRDQSPYPTTDLYSDFVSAHTSRTPIVYVGANDGILHGFEAQTGLEAIGYVPNKILDSSQRYRNTLDDFTSPVYLHKYFVNLTPRFNDVYMRNSRSGIGKGWNTVLVGGLGAGGKGFFALNVTDPGAQFTSELTAANSVLWEFTDEDDTYPVDGAGVPLGGAVGALTDPFGQPVKDLGVALSLPTIAMSNVGDGGAPEQKEWVAVFGNGPNSTAGIAKLFVLFLDRGLDDWSDAGDFVKLDTGFGVPLAPAQQAGFPNGLGTATAIDRDLNGTVDWVYAGDRLGNLYRFDLTDSDPDNWTTTRLFSATYFDGAVDRLQPILAKPLVVRHPTENGFLVVFGTGSHIAKEDAGSEEIQSIYAIWDRGELNPATASSDSKSLRLVEQTITNVVDDSVSPAQTRRIISKNAVIYAPESGVPGTYGWYIDLDMVRAANTLSGAANTDASGNTPPDVQFPGEKAIRRMVFRDGTIITTTVLPSTGETSCFGARPGSVLLFDAATGGDPVAPIIDFNNDGYIDSGDLVTVAGVSYAGGLLFDQDDLDGTLVDLSTLGGEGSTDFLFISGGNETTSFAIDDINESRTGRLSWRELDDAN